MKIYTTVEKPANRDDKVQLALNQYAREGWQLKSCYTYRTGDYDQVVLILEMDAPVEGLMMGET